MAVRVPPALNLAVLCSEIMYDADQRAFALNEPLYAISVAPAPDGKLPSAEFLLYIQLDDERALGTFWITAEARTANGIVIPGGRLPPIEVTFAGNADPQQPVELEFAYRRLVFPKPGRYYFHVLCNHLTLHGRDPVSSLPCLRVLPAEPPS